MNKLNKSLVIRYGEIFLKGKNREFFVGKLINNIKNSFKFANTGKYEIRKFSDFLIVNFEKEKYSEVALDHLKNVFGISVFYLSYIIDSKLENLYKFVEEMDDYYDFTDCSSFRLSISRRYKNFEKNSTLLQNELGKIISKNNSLRVDLKTPHKNINIIIYREIIMIFDRKIPGKRGLPVGSSGRTMVLMSGGIDSPVAAYEMMKRGMEVEYVHFYKSKENIEKIFEIVEKIKVYNNFSCRVFLLNMGDLLSEIRHISDEGYRLTILKRIFMKLSSSICKSFPNKDLKSLTTGDSLGQVASQTFESFITINEASDLFVFYPLVSFDKQEIIEIAKKIGTYDLSIKRYEDCCSLFQPRRPVTKPRIEKTRKLEKEIIYLEDVVRKVLKELEVFN
jgi:thiamine biosynthesis protein ThiI